MRIENFIHCKNLKESFDFYKSMMPPHLNVDIHDQWMVVNFFFLTYLVIIEKPSSPVEMRFYDVSIKKLWKHLEKKLPNDEGLTDGIKPGHRRGIYDHPGGCWVGFADTSGNEFYFEQPLVANDSLASELPEFDAKKIILTEW